MNRKRTVFLSLLTFTFATGLFLSSCADPRKNCNHPDHGKYMSEKLSKKRGIPK